MENFLIDVPVPAMGATVNELTVLTLRTKPGDQVSRGQKVAELESDKSVFEFESPCDGVVRAVFARSGEAKASGAPFLRIETRDESLRHLEVRNGGEHEPAVRQPEISRAPWTPKARKMAEQAGLDPDRITDIEPTGPGGRVSGDDVSKYLANRKT